MVLLIPVMPYPTLYRKVSPPLSLNSLERSCFCSSLRASAASQRYLRSSAANPKRWVQAAAAVVVNMVFFYLHFPPLLLRKTSQCILLCGALSTCRMHPLQTFVAASLLEQSLFVLQPDGRRTFAPQNMLFSSQCTFQSDQFSVMPCAFKSS